MNQNRAHVRMLIVAGVALLWFIAVFGRLGYLQLYRHREYLTRAQHQQQRTIEITPKRGAIYDRNMHPLAMSIPVDSAYAVPSEMADEQLAARLMSGVLGIPRDVLEARLESSRSFVWIKRKLPPDKKETLEALGLKGIYFQKENQRIYPKRDLASHVLGFVDLDEKGLAGIEYGFDGQIRGKSEKIMVMADGRQRPFDGGVAQRESGADVVLTLDEKIQYIVERELSAAIAKTHAINGTVVVMNPNNGEILAMANWPKFNPNMAGGAPAEARINRAVASVYEPGSTFKLMTMAAAFDQGITRTNEVFDCENGSILVAGHRIRDHKPFGFLTVSEILAQSSDVGAIKIATRLGSPRFYDYIRAFGFGQLTGVDLPGESRGILRRLEKWSAVSIGSVSMGQEVGVTPIQLATAVSAIANGGQLVRPHIVSQMRRGDTVLPNEGLLGVSEPKIVIRPQTAATLRKLMEGVVLNGTGKLAHLDGWTAAGKTGSAQKIDPATGRYSPTQLIASFTGFAPINSPAVTILVSLDSPVGLHEGGQVAAPVFKRIAEQVLPYLEVPRDVPIGARLIQAAYKGSNSNDEASLGDFTPVDLSLPAENPAASENRTIHTNSKPIDRATVTVALDEGGEIEVADFQGKTVREVTERCLQLGLDPVLVGSGIAVNQSPAAGKRIRRGGRITVQFGVPPAKNSERTTKARR
jgi:cell division protein FtsI (penicillin-binding protein 3)